MSTGRYTWTDDNDSAGQGLKIDGVPFDLVPCIAATLAIRQLLADIAERDARIAGLVELIDGAEDIVEIFQPRSLSQVVWRFVWLERARKAIAARSGNEEGGGNG